MATFPGTTGDDNEYGDFDQMFGLAGDDVLSSTRNGPVIIDGGPGMDNLAFDRGASPLIRGTIHGGDDNDVIFGGAQACELFGDGGDDYVFGNAHGDIVYGGDGKDLLGGNDLARDIVIYAGPGDDKGIIVVPDGSGGTFTIDAGVFGTPGNDKIYGDAGDDLISGSYGRDSLWGGPGADIFQFSSRLIADGGRQKVKDFKAKEHDVLDLSLIDAKADKIGDQKFKFIGNKDFHGKEGELRFADHKLTGDVDGDGEGDFLIKLKVDKLHDDDFVL